jgi:ADP-L-glycero-D-manno-heptose 6-epimerase
MIIITGGAGFIGSNLLAGFLDAGVTDLVISDEFGVGDKWRNISKHEVRDMMRPEHLMEFMDRHHDKIEMVYHMGGISSTTETDADAVVASNFALSRQLWGWCAKHGVRFVYASSVSTYGDGAAGFMDDETPEGLAKLRPLSPYGWSKLMFDRTVARIAAAKTEPMPPQWVGLKFFNVFGPNEYHKGDQRSVPSKLCPQVEAGAAVKLFRSTNAQYKDGGQMRDFIYVRDCVAVMLWLYKTKNVSGIFNVGTGKARTFNDLANAISNRSVNHPNFSILICRLIWCRGTKIIPKPMFRNCALLGTACRLPNWKTRLKIT